MKFVLGSMRREPTDQQLITITLKFLSNLPIYEKAKNRIAYHFEKAYFYYLDCYAKQPIISFQRERESQMKYFFDKIIKLFPNEFPKQRPTAIYCLLKDMYKNTPTNGVILLNKYHTRVLLTKTAGSNKWSFPKGKVQENESKEHCAIREIKQQIGVSLKLQPDNYIETDNGMHRFYIVTTSDEHLRSLRYVQQIQEGEEYEFEEIEQILDFSIEQLAGGHYSIPFNMISFQVFPKLLKKLGLEIQMPKHFLSKSYTWGVN